MYIINFYHNYDVLYVLATNRLETVLHTELLDAFKQHYANLISVYPMFKESVQISDCYSDAHIRFLESDNGYGLAHPDIRDTVLLAVVTSLKREVIRILDKHKLPPVDPWMQQQVDHPSDGYWESEADRWGCEDRE